MDGTGGASPSRTWSAAREEMRFFNRIMADHGRVFRAALDLAEDDLVREADRFVTVFETFQAKVKQVCPTDEESVATLVPEAVALVQELTAFKREAHRLLSQCCVQAIVRPAIAAHVLREALWYLGILERSLGRPGPYRRELELPDGDTRAALVPRGLIGEAPVSLNVVSLEYDLFWVHVQQEHADELSLHVRPEVQRRLHRALRDWEADLSRLHRRGLHVAGEARRDEHPRRHARRIEPAIARYNDEVWQTICRWRNYLVDLIEDLRHCRVPTGQTNFWPALAHHMRLEADYLLDALRRVDAAASGRLADDQPNPFIVEE